MVTHYYGGEVGGVGKGQSLGFTVCQWGGETKWEEEGAQGWLLESQLQLQLHLPVGVGVGGGGGGSDIVVIDT